MLLKVPFVGLDRQFQALRSELIEEFERIGNGGIYIMGEALERFEKELATYCGTNYAIGVANGFDALFLAMKVLDIGFGDEVITCPNSYLATTSAIIATGAKPVFVDTAEDYNINTDLLEGAITLNTKAILPIHLTGRPAEMDAITQISKKHKILVIEDAAQSIGARYRGVRVGAFGEIAGFSLHPLKNLGLYGDGGFITTDRQDLYEKLVKIRNHGLEGRDNCKFWGYNSRLDAIQAGFGSIKLKRLDAWNLRCTQIAKYYREELNNFVWVPTDKDYEEPVYHNFIIQSDRRDSLISYLNENGVGTRIHYPIPIHLQEAATEFGHKLGDFPLTERHMKTMISLPIFPELVDLEVEYVVNTVRNFFS